MKRAAQLELFIVPYDDFSKVEALAPLPFLMIAITDLFLDVDLTKELGQIIELDLEVFQTD